MLWARMSITASLLLAVPAPGQPPLMTPREFQAIPSLPADATSRYGTDHDQFGELRLPPGPGGTRSSR
ncbi:hypothetical protein FHS96_004789 [Sphingomonas zeicaulis]